MPVGRSLVCTVRADTTGPLANCLRVTIGTAEENIVFTKKLGKILSERNGSDI